MEKILAWITTLMLLMPPSALCADLYIQSMTAPVFSKPALNSIKRYSLPQGTKVNGLKKEGMWQQIQHDQAVGYIHTLMLAPTPPIFSEDISTDQVDQMAVTARKRPSAYASTAAARGLMNQRKRLGRKVDVDYGALKKMERYAADRQATLRFIKERELR